MQALPHSVAHRGATRTNARWHPYTPPRSSGGNTPNTSSLLASNPTHQYLGSHEVNNNNNYLISPANSVYTTSPAPLSVSQTPLPCSLPPPPPPIQFAAANQLRKTQSFPIPKPPAAKASYVASLVDQAVKSLSDIWRPECIPAVFATSTQITVTGAKSPLNSLRVPSKPQTVQQLPSPCSPTSHHSPYVPLSVKQSSVTSSRPTSSFITEHFGGNATIVSEKDLVPIRTFVQEVLRRSRTTCSVLQSALCYIEAIRQKVPCIADKERLNQGVREEPELDERIVKGDEACSVLSFGSNSNANSNEFVEQIGLGGSLPTISESQGSCNEELPTVLNTDADIDSFSILLSQRHQQIIDAQRPKQRKIPPKPTTPLPPLPSPLLCPRRTFLAALILASKFLQDRCYSNRAWAKLSGLSPREVGRCERALGEALEWRLWVGKTSTSNEESVEGRSLQRARSEASLPSGPPIAIRAVLDMHHIPSPPLSDAGTSPEVGRVAIDTSCHSGSAKSCSSRNRPLRRAATLPNDCLSNVYRTPNFSSTTSLPLTVSIPFIA